MLWKGGCLKKFKLKISEFYKKNRLKNYFLKRFFLFLQKELFLKFFISSI